MPNFENLKKKAKLFKRWHQDRHYPVAAGIRHWLPRFDQLDDKQILDAEFKLADAQALIAAMEGFDSWAALKKGLVEMSSSANQKAASTPRIIDAQPQLFVRDIDASLAFYAEKLKFEAAFRYGDPPFYAQVFRDGARLNLRHTEHMAFSEDFRHQGALPGIYWKGCAVSSKPENGTMGARTFIVRDLDGNLPLFAS